jgi:dCTP deaminase
MSLKSDRWIREMASKGMIEPFGEHQSGKGKISSGLSSYGYDMRLSDEFKIFQGNSDQVIDPKNFDQALLETVHGACIIPPHTFLLARSLEYFRIPSNILTICFGKSTYARCGIVVNVTPFEPSWEGYVTLSITNSGPAPVQIYPGEGIAQVLFLETSEACETSYADRKGRYQAQQVIQPAKA